MTNWNDLAHPISVIDPDGRFKPEYHLGLTKREYFAAMAMQGLLTRVSTHGTELGILESNRISEESVIMADKIIEALNKKEVTNATN